MISLLLPPRGEDFSQDLSQLLPGFHGLVEERSGEVDGH